MANCWGYLQPEHKGAPHMPKRTHAHARTLHPMWSVNREAGCCARKRTRLLLEREGGRSSSKKHGSLWNKRSSDTVIEDRERERGVVERRWVQWVRNETWKEGPSVWISPPPLSLPAVLLKRQEATSGSRPELGPFFTCAVYLLTSCLLSNLFF